MNANQTAGKMIAERDARIRKLEAELDNLLEAGILLQEDLLLRAQMRNDVDPDGTVVVDCSASRWSSFCDALKRCAEVIR